MRTRDFVSRLIVPGLVLVAGLTGCRKPPVSQSDQPPRAAPVLSLSVVNPPLVETQHQPGKTNKNSELRTIAEGSIIQVRNNEAIALETASAGQTFSGLLARDVMDSSGRVALPRGAGVTLVILRPGIVDIGSVEVAGRRYGLEGPKSGDAQATGVRIPARALLGFRLDKPAKLRELQ